MTAILGISALYHDSAAALVVDGQVVAAAQEERFSRRKHDARYPQAAIDYVLEEAGLSLSEISSVAFYDKPFLKFERLLESYLACAPRGLRSFSKAMPVWLREKLFLKNFLLKSLRQRDEQFTSSRLRFTEHHFSHAASAFYPSPFDEAVVLTLDGVGEWATSSVAIGRGADLKIERQLEFPHSLGLLYSAFTYYTGFRVNSGEYKLMGLAPYGDPCFRDLILEHLIDVKADGSFRLDQRYFDYTAGLTMVNKRFCQLFGQPVRRPDTDPLTAFHMNVAASVQAVTEEVVLRMVRSLTEEFGIREVCLAGGVALNCVANGKVLRSGAVDNLWIQPAAGDAGGALGAALAIWHHELKEPRKVTKGTDSMCGSYLGPALSMESIEAQLTECGANFEQLSSQDTIDRTARLLADGSAVGWFQGRMEFGPRALGGRSILADPRSPDMQRNLNLKVKFRESFRPFAPSVLASAAADWFELDSTSPYMLLVADISEKHRLEISQENQNLCGIERLNIPHSAIPAVTHVDYSARVQTVDGRHNSPYFSLIKRFEELTGCPVLVNTSFNVRGEPIVGSATDAFRCFMGTNLDALVIENFLLLKDKQDPALAEDYQNRYALD